MIIVPGSVNADLLFKVAKLPRPGETVLCPSYVMAPGGKGANQAAAAAKAGAEVAFVGHVGGGRLWAGRARAPGGGRGGLRAAGGLARTHGDRRDRRRRGRRERDHRRQRRQSRDGRRRRCRTRCCGPDATVLCQNEIRPAETFAALIRAKRLGRADRAQHGAGRAPCRPRCWARSTCWWSTSIEAETVAGVSGQPPEAVARRLATSYGLTCVVTLGGAGCIAVTAGAGWRVPVAADPPGRHHRRRRHLRRRAHGLAGRRRRPGRRPARGQRRRRLQL